MKIESHRGHAHRRGSMRAWACGAARGQGEGGFPAGPEPTLLSWLAVCCLLMLGYLSSSLSRVWACPGSANLDAPPPRRQKALQQPRQRPLRFSMGSMAAVVAMAAVKLGLVFFMGAFEFGCCVVMGAITTQSQNLELPDHFLFRCQQFC